MQLQAVSTPQSVVSGSGSIHRFVQSDITNLAFATGRLLEPWISSRRQFVSASNVEIVSDAMQRIAKDTAEAPQCQVIEKYWNTTMQQNNIWSIAFEARTKEFFKEVC